ncbi:protein O-mannosyl-transferase TMTC1-like [Diadema setosum]|uniref:protein O-mannosyl-transferase TMTC1-like n=1 Tax=Diadema setosum TaxID=31175 RepID=UPI003B3AA5E5
MTMRRWPPSGRKSHSPSSSHHSNNNNNNLHYGSSSSLSKTHPSLPVARERRAVKQDQHSAHSSNASLPLLSRSHIHLYIIIAVVSFVLFSNTLYADFVHDDIFAIKNNKDVLPSTALWKVFQDDFWGKSMSDNTSHKSYRPLCILTFRLNYLVSGLQPFSYHLVNILLHSSVSVLFMYVCQHVIFQDITPAFISALLFAVHPIHCEAVAGVVGRADVLSCLMFLLSFLAFISLLRPRDLWQSVKFRAVAVRCAVLFCAVSVFLGFRIWMLNGHLPHFSEEDNPAAFADHMTTRFLTYSYLVAFNIGLLLCPVTLSYDWQVGSIPLIESWRDSRNLATLAAVGGLLSLGLHCLVRSKSDEKRILLCGLLFLAIPFLPASNLFFKVGFVVAERILYIPSLGFCILLAWGISKLYSNTTCRMLRILLAFCTLTTIFCLCQRTWIRNGVWKSRETLFRSGLETLPHNAKMHYNYGNYLMDSGFPLAAIERFEETLRLHPQHASANNNLGTLLSQDQPERAKKYFLRALQINPRHAKAYFNLANLYSDSGELTEAERLLEKALEIDPASWDTLNSLASIKQRQGKEQAAEVYYLTALGLAEVSADVHNNYAAFLMSNDRYQESLHHYQECLTLDPSHSIAMTNMARLLRLLNRTTEAEEMYKRALSVDKSAKTLQSLAAVYYNTNRPGDALIIYQQALELEPENTDIQLQYAQVLTRLGRYGDAERFLQAGLHHDRDMISFRRLLSSIYSIQHQYTRALHEVDYILDHSVNLNDETKAELIFERGNYLKGLNRLDQAKETYEAALALNPDMGSCLLNLGALHHIRGEYKQARIYYEQALILDPGNSILIENISKLNRAESRAKKS